MQGWSCPHLGEEEICKRVRATRCDPGMKGCILGQNYVFLKERAKPGECVNSAAAHGASKSTASGAVDAPGEEEIRRRFAAWREGRR